MAKTPNVEDEREMTLLGHLEELRWRLVIADVTLAVSVVVCFTFAGPVLELLIKPVTAMDEIFNEREAPEPDANIQLGECEVTDLPPGLPAKSPIQVRLSCETNGRVHVMALDMTGGKFAHAEIKRNAGLTEDDIRREAEFVNSLQIQ